MSVKEITDNTAHSAIGASSMYRWSECPGSVQMSAMAIAPSSSIHAIMGTIAHEVAAFFLEHGFWPVPDEYNLDITELDAMVKAVSVYTDYIARRKAESPHAKVHVETRFDLASVYPGAFGTADCVIYDAASGHLEVIDYKHGSGLVVEVENNLQLLYYALGAVTALGYPFQDLNLVIVQPRAFHPKGVIRNWTIGAEEILDFRATLIAAAKRTEEKDPEFKAGKHCFFCSAIDICPKSDEAKAAKRSAVMAPLFKSDPKDDFEPVPM